MTLGTIIVTLLLSARQVRPLLIGQIENTDMAKGCGCRFWSSDEKNASRSRIVFFSEGSGRPALMHLDGRDIWLRLITLGADDKWGTRKGDASVVKYAACDMDVEIHRTIALSDCPAAKDDCEYVNMTGTLTVSSGREKETRKIVGACGC